MKISENNIERYKRILESHEIKDYSFSSEGSSVFIEFFKRVIPQPSCEFEEDIYEELVDITLKNSFKIELRKIDASPEDMPSETEFVYYWAVKTPTEKLEESLNAIENIESAYLNKTNKFLHEYLSG